MYAKWKDLKKSSTGTLNAMDSVCNVFEKTKNLINWEQQRMTTYFTLFAFIMFIFVTFMPVRIILMVYLTHRFYRGQFYHKRRVRNNREVLLIEYANFIDDNRSTLMPRANSLILMADKWEIVVGKTMKIKEFE